MSPIWFRPKITRGDMSGEIEAYETVRVSGDGVRRVTYVSEEERMKAEDRENMERLQAIRTAGGGCNHEDKALLLELLDQGQALLLEGAAHLKELERHLDELTRAGDVLLSEADEFREHDAAIAWQAAKANRPRA